MENGAESPEVGLRPVVVVADEIGSIVALMDSKQAKRFVADLSRYNPTWAVCGCVCYC